MGGITITLRIAAAVICPVGGLAGGGLLGLFCSQSCSCWLKGSCCWLRGSFTINFPALADDLVTSTLFFLLILGALAVALSSPFAFLAFFFNFLLSATLGMGGWSEDAGGVASSSERI